MVADQFQFQLEPHVLQNFEPVADTDVVRISKYQWSHCNMNVERMVAIYFLVKD